MFCPPRLSFFSSAWELCPLLPGAWVNWPPLARMCVQERVLVQSVTNRSQGIRHSCPLCMGSIVLDWWLRERTNNLEEAPFFLTVDEIGFSSLYSHFKRHIWLLMVSYCLWPPGNQLKVRYYWRKATADRRSYFCYVPAEGVRSPTAYEYIK